MGRSSPLGSAGLLMEQASHIERSETQRVNYGTCDHACATTHVRPRMCDHACALIARRRWAPGASRPNPASDQIQRALLSDRKSHSGAQRKPSENLSDETSEALRITRSSSSVLECACTRMGPRRSWWRGHCSAIASARASSNCSSCASCGSTTRSWRQKVRGLNSAFRT